MIEIFEGVVECKVSEQKIENKQQKLICNESRAILGQLHVLGV